MVHDDNPAVANVCFSPNGRFVLAFNLDNCIRLWDYVAGSVKKTYQGHCNEKLAIGGCFAVLDGQAFLASASEDGYIILWDVKSKHIIQKIRGHQGVCFWVDIHEDTLVSAGQDTTVRVYRNDNTSRPTNGHSEENGVDNQVTSLELPIRQEDIKAEAA